MAHSREFYLYKRKKKLGSYWYVCFIDKTSGKQMTAKSIDVIKEKLGIFDFERTTGRDDAVIIANKALESGLIFGGGADIDFAQYLIDFWTYDTSPYIKLRNNCKPGSIGREYAGNMLYAIKKHVLPCLRRGISIRSVTAKDLDAIVEKMFRDGLSASSIKIVSYSFTVPLKEALRKEYISKNPADHMVKISRADKVRGVLSRRELDSLCRILISNKDSIDSSYYLALSLALCSGMRLSEIRALNTADLLPSPYAEWTRLEIRHSIGYYTGLKSTKSKETRSIYIPSSLASKLIENANDRGICFPSKYKSGYLSAPSIRNEFYRLLGLLGIDEEERRRRNITFHSLRHTFSTLGRDFNVSQEDRMAVLGHRSEEVNNIYTHVSDEALLNVSRVTDYIFSQFEVQ